MQTLKVITTTLMMFFTVLALGQSRQVVSDQYSQILDQKVHATVEQASQELNKRLPMIINSQTRVDTSIVGPGRRFTYLYTDISDQSRTATAEQIESETGLSVRNKVCTTAALKLLIDNDYLITYKYFDIDGKFIDDITVKQSECKGRGK